MNLPRRFWLNRPGILEIPRRCAVLLSNDVPAECIFPDVVALVLGRTRMPWHREYGRLERPD